MPKKTETDWTRYIIIGVLLVYIISPLDFMPLVELDDGFAGILIGKLLDNNK